MFPPEALEELMQASDYVVAALPHTPGTEKLIGRQAISAMKPTAVFINVGRGKTVDEEALTQGAPACVRWIEFQGGFMAPYMAS